jgi:short-chain fatty acids transporter
MINALTNFFTSLTRRFLPDAFIFAMILTLLIFVLGLVQGHPLLKLVQYWGDGLWNLLNFSMQMVLILVTGQTLAKTTVIKRLLNRLADLAQNKSQAIFLVTFVALVACYLNWGFGLIVAALFSVEVSKRVPQVNQALLLACAYSGFLVWHGGLSGSIPLSLASANMYWPHQQFTLGQTIFSYWNILLLLLVVLTIFVTNWLMGKTSKLSVTSRPEFVHPVAEFSKAQTWSEKLEQSRILNWAFACLGMIYLILSLETSKSFDLNKMILLFLSLSLFFSDSTKHFILNFKNSTTESAGIILQFPLYAGMMGIMSSSGMASVMTNAFITLANRDTFLVFTYWSAGLLNFFIPSGGGQWAVQAPIILPAAKELGVDVTRASMAIAWGDAWTNMVQPFWALPLLSLAKISLSDLMGHCVLIFLTVGAVTSLYFYFI